MSNNSSYAGFSSCLDSRYGLIIFTAFFIFNIFLIPLFIHVLYLGYQQRHKRRSGSTVSSHVDIFTYNVIVLELISLNGCFLYCCGGLMKIPSMIRAGMDTFAYTSHGQSVFHVLTCVERYLAVAHPITYLSLKQAKGVRMRNVIVCCVWLQCFSTLGYAKMFSMSTVNITKACFMVILMIVVTFCSLSVLWILIRSRPGEGVKDRESVDQSKRRAFYTITVIMGVLLLRFVGVFTGSMMFRVTFTEMTCTIASSVIFLTIPGSLVLPLLFLHRAGKLHAFKHRT